MEKFIFELKKDFLPWIDFESGRAISSPDFVPIRQGLFKVYPFATTTNMSKIHSGQRSIVCDNEQKISIAMKKGCASQSNFELIGTWRKSSDFVHFECEIDTSDCNCSPESVSKFFKNGRILNVNLSRKRKLDTPTVEGLKYERKVSGEVGRAFFASVCDYIDDDGIEVERGEINEIAMTCYTKKHGDPLCFAGALSEESKHQIMNSYAAVLRLGKLKSLDMSLFNENQTLVSVQSDNYDSPMEGPSMRLAASVAFFSLLIEKPVPNAL